MQATRNPSLLHHTLQGVVRQDLGRWRFWRVLNGCVIAAGDLLAITLTGLLINLFSSVAPDVLTTWLTLVGVIWVLGASMLHLLPDWGMAPPSQLERLTKLMTLAFLIASTVTLMVVDTRPGVSLLPLLALPLAVVLVMLVRSVLKTALIRGNVWGVPVAIYGGAVTGSMIVDALRKNPGYGYRPVGVFDDDRKLQGASICGVPVLGPCSSALDVPVAFLAMPGLQRVRLVELLEGPLARYPKVVLIPDLFETESMWAQARDFGGVMGLEVSRNLLNRSAQWVKRGLDIGLVVLSVPFWVPLCLLLGLLIWREDRTSPVFLQKRVGFGDQPFTAWKFRTMVPNAEAVLQQKLASDPELRAEWEQNYKLRHDPRITRVGRLLRRSSLDELPQLVNVLRGEMSLVGPRPLPPYHHDQLSPQTQRLRIMVRPGMTGLWQVSGRSDSGNDGMERWDPYYVRNWSIWLDGYILAQTLRVVFKGSGAY